MTFYVPGEMKLSKNFTLSEFACNDNSRDIIVDYELVDGLQLLRDRAGRAIYISSGYRTPKYNKECGGIDGSEHTLGRAADIKIIGIKPFDLAYMADQLKVFTGIGVYPTFTHVDVGDYKGYWYQNEAGKKTFYKTLEALRLAHFAKK